tara:strand:+ start:56 stop:535 length:480 start_codon:yes stop_codon:yes gene_type:complete
MHNKQNNKESKTYVQGLRRFGNTLPRGIKGVLKKSGYNYSEIINKWKNLVGREISDCCYPKSIKIGKDNMNGTLLIAVKRGDEINVEYSKREIINKINSYFGYELINKIKLQTINSDKVKFKKKYFTENFSNNFESKINEIKNRDLKDSLKSLLEIIKK